jgi:hypothetical protein
MPPRHGHPAKPLQRFDHSPKAAGCGLTSPPGPTRTNSLKLGGSRSRCVRSDPLRSDSPSLGRLAASWLVNRGPDGRVRPAGFAAGSLRRWLSSRWDVCRRQQRRAPPSIGSVRGLFRASTSWSGLPTPLPVLTRCRSLCAAITPMEMMEHGLGISITPGSASPPVALITASRPNLAATRRGPRLAPITSRF